MSRATQNLGKLRMPAREEEKKKKERRSSVCPKLRSDDPRSQCVEREAFGRVPNVPSGALPRAGLLV